MYDLVYCTTYARRHGGAVDVWWAKPGGIEMLSTSILLMSVMLKVEVVMPCSKHFFKQD
jgi:hypothetical protein